MLSNVIHSGQQALFQFKWIENESTYCLRGFYFEHLNSDKQGNSQMASACSSFFFIFTTRPRLSSSGGRWRAFSHTYFLTRSACRVELSSPLHFLERGTCTLRHLGGGFVRVSRHRSWSHRAVGGALFVPIVSTAIRKLLYWVRVESCRLVLVSLVLGSTMILLFLGGWCCVEAGQLFWPPLPQITRQTLLHTFPTFTLSVKFKVFLSDWFFGSGGFSW